MGRKPRSAFRLLLIFLATATPLVAWSAPPFAEWLAAVRLEAIQRGISGATVASALAGIEPDPRVIGFDRSQPEFVQTFEQYLAARVTPEKIAEGRRLLQQHRRILRRIGDKYGVDPRYLVAFWGLESSFGRYQGKYSVIRSLATLAQDERRSAFFREELFAALRIIDEEHIAPERMLGGWAGAMGQNQFLPSSFRKYAEDFNGDGVKDIWGNTADVWASIANYLNKNGWHSREEWGTRVQLPAGFAARLADLRENDPSPSCSALRDHTRAMSLAAWQAQGVRVAGGADLPDRDLQASLVFADAEMDHSYLAYPNYRAILSYNCANKYAVSVGLMADQLAN